MENQRISKLIAEVVFGLCFIGAFIFVIIGTVCITGITITWFLITRILEIPIAIWGIFLIIIGVLLGVLGTSIKTFQALFSKIRAKKEFAKAAEAKANLNK